MPTLSEVVHNPTLEMPVWEQPSADAAAERSAAADRILTRLGYAAADVYGYHTDAIGGATYHSNQYGELVATVVTRQEAETVTTDITYSDAYAAETSRALARVSGRLAETNPGWDATSSAMTTSTAMMVAATESAIAAPSQQVVLSAGDREEAGPSSESLVAAMMGRNLDLPAMTIGTQAYSDQHHVLRYEAYNQNRADRPGYQRLLGIGRAADKRAASRVAHGMLGNTEGMDGIMEPESLPVSGTLGFKLRRLVEVDIPAAAGAIIEPAHPMLTKLSVPLRAVANKINEYSTWAYARAVSEQNRYVRTAYAAAGVIAVSGAGALLSLELLPSESEIKTTISDMMLNSK